MCIYHHKKTIFVHIPKTGGIFIRKALKLPNPTGVLDKDHVRPSFLGIKEYWEDYFTFTFVRNPYDRLVSSYFFDHLRSEQGRNINEGNIRKEIVRFDKTPAGFGNFIKEFMPIDFNKNRKYISMSNILENYSLDFIGKLENLDEDIRKAYHLIHSRPIPKVPTKKQNTSPRKNYQFYYKDDKIKKMVYDYYYQDFIQFGYEE